MTSVKEPRGNLCVQQLAEKNDRHTRGRQKCLCDGKTRDHHTDYPDRYSYHHRHHHHHLHHRSYQRHGPRAVAPSWTYPSRPTLYYLTAFTIALISLLPAVQAQTRVTLGPLREEEPSNKYVGNIASATGISKELTNNEFSSLQFIILDSTPLFTMSAQSGALFTSQMIDRERECPDRPECLLEFDVTVKSDAIAYFKIVEVIVNITDINDNRPRFPREEIIVDIPENNEVGLVKLLPSAVDPDVGQNTVQEYFMLEPSEKFSLRVERRLNDRFQVSLVVNTSLNREERELYKLLIAAKDGGVQPFTGTLTVHVNVTDKNDNKPQFTQPSYSFSVQETAGTGKVVGKLTATDDDSGRNSDVRYSMSFSNRDEKGHDLFAIDQFTGEITIISPLQYYAGKTFQAVVEAQDRGDPPKVAEATMTITVVNVGNNAPVLEVKLQKTKFSQTVSIPEDAHNNTFIGKLTATDNDPGPSGRVRCRSVHPSFRVDDFGDYYAIFMNGTLNREEEDNIDVTIVCSDSGTPPMTASVVFNVVVLDVNDNAPMFNQSLYTVNVVEENVIGKQIFKIKAVDPDDYNNNVFTYTLFPPENSVFSIDEHTGIIKARTTFDHEVEKRLNVIVLATDSGNPSLVSTATVVVNILDINDNYPDITTKVLRVPEGGGPLTWVGRIRATDKDSGLNSELVFSMPPTADYVTSQIFRVDTDGTVVALQELDRETTASYDLRIEVRDRGEPAKMKAGTVRVIVEDINDNEPVFLFPNQRDQSVIVLWSTLPNTELVRLNATDEDAGENKTISYIIYSGNNAGLFALDPNSGSLTLKRLVHPDDPQLYKLMIAARDRGPQPQESVTFLDIVVDVSNSTVAWLEWDFERETEEELRKAKEERFILIAGVVAGVTLLISIIIIVVMILIRREGASSRRRRRQQAPVALSDKPAQWHVVKMGVQEEGGGKGGGEMEKVAAWRGSDVDIDLKDGSNGGGRDASSYGQPDVTKTGNDGTLKKTVASSHWHDGKDDALQGSASSTIGIGLDPYRKQDFYTFCKVRSTPHDDVNSVTSGETATSDSGRGGSEDDIPLPPIAECSPELNSNHSSPKHVVEYRPITTSPPNSLGRQPYGGKSEFRTMPTLSSFRGGSDAIKLYPVTASTTKPQASDKGHSNMIGHSPYNSLPSSYGDKVHPSGKSGQDFRTLAPVSYTSGGGGSGGSPAGKTIGSQGRHVTFSPGQPAVRGPAHSQHSPPSLFSDPNERSSFSPFAPAEGGGVYYSGSTSRPRSIDDDDGNTTTSGSYTIDSDNLNDSIISA